MLAMASVSGRCKVVELREGLMQPEERQGDEGEAQDIGLLDHERRRDRGERQADDQQRRRQVEPQQAGTDRGAHADGDLLAQRPPRALRIRQFQLVGMAMELFDRHQTARRKRAGIGARPSSRAMMAAITHPTASASPPVIQVEAGRREPGGDRGEGGV